MEDDVFYSHFRMRRSTFKKLHSKIKPFWVLNTKGRVNIPLYKAMYMTIWKLSNNSSFRDISDRFGVAIGTAYKLFVLIIKYVCHLKSDVIKFPDTLAEQRKTSEKFLSSRRNPFPFVLGCIDGTHIQISQPLKDSVSFYNRKGTYSIIIQAIADSEMKFTDVFIGCPGRCHDAAVWHNSPLKKSIENGVIAIPQNYHLLGDGAYPLEINLMVPYRDNGFLTTQQSKFNMILSSTRVFIEQALGILKIKFRILKFIEVQRPHLPKMIAMACIILHNIIILNEGVDSEISEDMPDDTENNSLRESINTTGQRREAESKRDSLATLFSA